MFRSRFMPCQECGESLERDGVAVHECVPERRADYQLFALRDEVAQLEDGIRHYLTTTAGLFEAWYAARQVRSQG